MPEINLIINSDLSGINTAFAQGEALIDETSNAVNKFSGTVTKASKTATNETKQFNDELKKGKKNLENLDQGTKAIPQATNRLKELRNEVKALTSQAIILKQQGDITGSNEAIKSAGRLKDEIKDIQDAIKSVSGNIQENFTNAIGKATGLAAQGFEAATAASALFGEKNEDVEKSLLKLQAIQSLSRIASEFGDIKDRIREIGSGLSPLTNGLKTLYTSGNAGLLAFKKGGLDGIKQGFINIGSGAKSFFMNFGSNLKGFVSSAISGFKSIGAVAAANPFGVVLIAIVAVIGIMVALRDKIKPIKVLFDLIGDAVGFVLDKLEAVGQFFGLVASESEKASQSVIDNTNDEIAAIQKKYDYEIKLLEAAGASTKKAEKQKLDAVVDRVNQSIVQLKLKNMREGELEKEDLKLYKELQEQRIDLNKDFAIEALKTKTEENKKKAEEEEKANQDRIRKEKEANDKLKAARKDLADFLLNLAKQSNAAEIELLSGEAKINAQHKADEKEIELLKKTFLEKEKLVGKENQLTLEQAEQFNNLQLLADKKQADAILALRVAEAKKIADANKKAIDDEVAFLDRKKALAIAVIEGSQNTTKLSEVEFEKSKQRAILNVQIDALNESLDLKIKQIAANEALTKRDIDRQTDLIIDETDAQVEKIKRELEKLDKDSDKFSLAKLLGLDEDKFKAAMDAIKPLMNEVNGLIQQQLDLQLDANEKLIESSKEKQDQIKEEIDELKSKLNEEQKLSEQGLANNTDRINKEIQDKIAQQAAEKAIEDKAIEQRKKIQKEKLALDTIIQASNLFTAATQIFATTAKDPITTGIAVATIAAMIAAFTLQKAAALKAINEGNGFKKGGYTGGSSVDEERGVVHGKEFVHTAEQTKAHRNLFEGIHKDDKLLIHKGILELLDGKGISLEPNIATTLASKKDNLRMLTNNNLSINNKGLEDRIDELNLQVNVLSKELKNKTTVLNDGSIIEKFGNVTRIIKK